MLSDYPNIETCSICGKIADFYCNPDEEKMYLCIEHKKSCCKLIIVSEEEINYRMEDIEKLRIESKDAIKKLSDQIVEDLKKEF